MIWAASSAPKTRVKREVSVLIFFGLVGGVRVVLAGLGLIITHVCAQFNIYLRTFMHSFSDRLREQRDALGLSQQALADGCSIALRSQQNYEKGLRSPDSDYLAALHEQGFDVLYILTGQRSQRLPPEAALPPDERVMLDNFRHAPAAVQVGVKTTLSAFAPEAGGVKRRAAG